MVATAIAKPTSYFGPARTKFLIADGVIAGTTTGVWTRAEIDAADDITPAISSFEGGEFSSNSQDVQLWTTLNPDKVPNFNSLSDITLTTNADIAGADVRSLLTLGGDYVLARMDSGDTPTRKMDTFFVTVASKSKQITTSGNAKYVFGLTCKSVYQDVAIPAA